MLARALRALEGASDPKLVGDLHAWLGRHRSYTEGEIQIAMAPGQVRALAVRSWRGTRVLEQSLSRSHLVAMSRHWAMKRREQLAKRLSSAQCRRRRQVTEVFGKISVALELGAGNVVGDMLIDLSAFALEIVERDFGVEVPRVEVAERRVTVSAPADEVWNLRDALQERLDSYEGGELRSLMALRKRLLTARKSAAPTSTVG